VGYVSAVKQEEEETLENVPKKFRSHLAILGKKAADALPKHQSYDCKIELKEGETAPWGPIYPLSEEELAALREWLKEMLRTGKIRRFTSPAGSPILFVPKPKGRGLRLCVDYCALNRITVPNRYPLPLMQELQDRVQGAQWFTKMDLKNGFNLIRIREGDEWKTTFRTLYGLYEFQVMPFGLTNAPSTFQDMMNHVFSDLIDLGLVAYMDDILIYAKTLEEHDQMVHEVLTRLQTNGLAVSPEKCVWQCQDPASTSPFVSTGNVGGVCSASGPTHTSGVLTLPAYSHFRRTRTPCVSSVFSRYPSRPAWSLRGSSHTPCVGSLFSRYPSHPVWSLRGSSHTPCVGSLFSRYPSRPAWSLHGSSHTPCVGSLFSRYPLRPVWSLRGSSHTPCVGSLFSRYPSRLAWSLRGSSHMPCVGSLFSGSGGRSAGHGDREVGLWREIIDCVEKNLQTSYRALPLYFSFPLWNHSFPARLTQFLRLTS